MSTGMLPPGQALAESCFVGVLSYDGQPCGGCYPCGIAAKTARSRMRGKLHAYDTLLAGLARDLHDMEAELRQFIQKENPVVGQ
jgi:hypothetical protein